LNGTPVAVESKSRLENLLESPSRPSMGLGSVNLLWFDAGAFNVSPMRCESMCICHSFDLKALACSTLTPVVFEHRISISSAGKRRNWAPDSVGANKAGNIGGVSDCNSEHIDHQYIIFQKKSWSVRNLRFLQSNPSIVCSSKSSEPLG
jgi:hypothetical protein